MVTILKKEKKRIIIKINEDGCCEKREKEQNLKISPKSYHGERQDHFMISCLEEKVQNIFIFY